MVTLKKGLSLNKWINKIPGSLGLGPLEAQLMEILWTAGECSVRYVAERLERKPAYTTVMTTLDRLFKKGLLDRRTSKRAFLYVPCLSREEWERRCVGDLVARLLAGSQPAPDLLLSSLVDTVGQHDVDLLEELKEKIRRKRKELSKKL